MEDPKVLDRIDELVAEEHRLRSHADRHGLKPEEERRLEQLEVTLDQCWDLLRQRRARREFGMNPEEAAVRDPDVVEQYRQ